MDKKHSETLVLPPKNANNFLIRKLTSSPILDSAVVFDTKIKCILKHFTQVHCMAGEDTIHSSSVAQWLSMTITFKFAVM